MNINYNLPPKACLVQLANLKNGTSLSPTDVEVENVVAVDPEEFRGRNSTFTLVPAGLSGKIGTETFYYKRIDANLFFGGNIRIQTAGSAIGSPLDTIIYINAAYRVQIPLNYIDQDLSTWDPATKTGTLVFDPAESWIWLGSVAFTVYGVGEYLERDMGELYPDNDLDGFDLGSAP